MPATVAAPGDASFDDMGRLLFGNDGRRSFAVWISSSSTVVRRRHHRRVAPGAFRDDESGGPLVPVGQAIVLTVGEDTATVIADGVRDSLTAGDWGRGAEVAR